MTDDWQLVRRYVDDGDEAAFAELARRYTNLVYGVSLRESHDRQMAEDITQAVFLILARKAKTFRQGVALPSWLFQTTLLASRNALKQERRLKARERKAAEEMTPSNPTGHSFSDAEAHLHEALEMLPAPEKNAVLLRYFENMPLAEVGASLGVSDDAARMRVTRGVEKLRRYLSHHNVILSVAILAAGLEESFHPAPAHCATLAAMAGLATGSTPVSSRTDIIAQGVHHLMKLEFYKTAGITAISIAGITVLTGLVFSAATKNPAPATVPTSAPGPVLSIGAAPTTVTGSESGPAIKIDIKTVSLTEADWRNMTGDIKTYPSQVIQALGRAPNKVVSNFTIETRDGVTASINDQAKIPYTVGPTTPGQPSTQAYVTVGQNVSVTPHVIAAGMIKMSLNLTDAEAVPAPAGHPLQPGFPPTITTTQLNTTATARNGIPVVIVGGVESSPGSPPSFGYLVSATIVP